MRVDIELVKRFVPLQELADAEQRETLNGARLISFQPGDVIFREGTEQPRLLYLVSGQVALSSSHGGRSILRADAARAQRPLLDEQRAVFDCVAKDAAKVLSLPLIGIGSEKNQMLDVTGYEVEEIAVRDSKLWLRVLANTPQLLRIPAANVQAVIAQSDELRVPGGEVVVRQGDAADDYYIVKHGTFNVIRRDQATAEETLLAELGDGTAFGEDALISRARRNASVVARRESAVLRLPKSVFTRYIVNPLLDPISLREAHRLQQKGGILCDVRSDARHAADGLPGSVNIPFAALRGSIGNLERSKPIILYCDDGHLSAAAAFILIQYGITAYLVAGGLSALSQAK